MLKRLAIGMTAAGLVMACAGAVTTPAQASVYCDPSTTVTYRQVQWQWQSYEHGEINNASRASSATVSYSYSKTFSLSSTIEDSSTVSLGTALAGASDTLKISVTGSASYTKGHTFSVTAGPRSDVNWRNGVIQRDILVKKHQIFTNCDTRDNSTYLHAADNLLQVTDA